MKNGRRSNDNEKLSDIIINQRHPRSIIGTVGNKIYLTVIDGLNNKHSCGTIIEETNAYNTVLGIKETFNFVGEGSSSLW